MKKSALQSELEATQKQLAMLERATKEIGPYVVAGEFTASYLHDENHSLSTLAMDLTMILKRLETDNVDSPRLRKLIQQMASTVDNMQTRHDDMWLIIRDGESEVSLSESIRNSVGLLRNRFDRKRIDVNMRIGLEAGRLRVPAHWYRTILICLLSNCISTSKPGGKIMIAADVDADVLVLVVEDNGRRKDAEAIADVWDAGGPTGYDRMGLWIVKRTVDDIGGTIALEKGVGTGAKFVLKAPLKRSQTNE